VELKSQLELSDAEAHRLVTLLERSGALAIELERAGNCGWDFGR